MTRLLMDAIKTILRLCPPLYDRAFMWYWRYEFARSLPEDLKNRVQTLGPDSLAIDLGANIGQTTAMLAKTGAKVIAFEPDTLALRILRKTANRYPNVGIIEAAAGIKNRTATMYRRPGAEKYLKSTEVSSLLSNHPGISTQIRQEIIEIDFARFLRDLGRPVDLLKIDIEGYEIALLNDLCDKKALRDVKLVLVEFHDWFIPEQKPQVAKLKKRLGKTFPDTEFHFDWI